MVRAPDRFRIASPDTVFPLQRGRALWMRLTLQRSEGAHEQWLLAYTNPLVDQVEVWQLDAQGRWQRQAAGDRIAVEAWPERGRYPVFRLDLPAGPGPRRVPAHAQRRPDQCSPSAPHRRRAHAAAAGRIPRPGRRVRRLVLLIAACLAQSWAYRDRAYGWYAVYTGVATLCLMAYSGMAAHLLWPRDPAWADAAPGVLAFLSAGAAILFVRRLTGIAARSARLDRAGYVLGWAGLPLALAYLAGPRQAGVQMLSAYLCGRHRAEHGGRLDAPGGGATSSASGCSSPTCRSRWR